MRFFERRRPNVKALAKSGKVDDLVEASQYRDMLTTREGAQLDAGAPIREEAVIALGDAFEENGGEAILERLAQALDDPVDRVRCTAVMTLHRVGQAGPLAEGVARLPVDEGQARATAVRALLALRAPGSSAQLASALLQRADELALGAADAQLVLTLVEEEGDPHAARAVIDLAVAGLSSDRSVVVFRAEELLERLAPASLDVLVDELGKGRASHRAAAVLGRMKDSRALEPLVAALGHPDPRVRSESCAALGELRDPAAAEPLLLATRDPEYEVRARAGTALDSLGTAAIAVSVATLLRPLIASSTPEPYALPLPTNGNGLPAPEDSIEWHLVLEEPPAEKPSDHPAPRRRNQRQKVTRLE